MSQLLHANTGRFHLVTYNPGSCVSFLNCALFESCSAALCPDPVGIENGMVTFTSNSIGDTATYSCDPGFELIGSAITTCTQVDANSAVFQPVQSFCRREYTE